MKKSLDITFKILIVAALLIMAAVINTCTYDVPSESKKTEMSFRSETFRFSRYINYTEQDSVRSTYDSRLDSGSIELYGDVIRVNKTSEKVNYFIISEEYDDEEQVYTFLTKNATITFDVMMAEFTVHNNETGEGDVFFINSTINTNW